MSDMIYQDTMLHDTMHDVVGLDEIRAYTAEKIKAEQVAIKQQRFNRTLAKAETMQVRAMRSDEKHPPLGFSSVVGAKIASPWAGQAPGSFSLRPDTVRMNSAAGENSTSACADSPRSHIAVREGGHQVFKRGGLQSPLARGNLNDSGQASPLQEFWNAGQVRPLQESRDFGEHEKLKSAQVKLDELTKSIKDLTDAMHAKQMSRFLDTMQPVLEKGLSVRPTFTPIPGSVSSPAYEEAMNRVPGPLAAGDMAAGASIRGASAGKAAGKGSLFDYGSYSYGGYGGGGKGAISGVPGDLKQVGTLAGMFGKTGGEIGQGANILAGAFGIANQGAQQGITIGNVLSGATQGAEIGSLFGPAGTLIGAAAGGLLDVIGGLFHSHHGPDYSNLTQPAMSNSPGDFDYAAYRYRATGSLTTDTLHNLGQLPGGLLGQANYMKSQAPTVVVYLGSVQQAVSQQITQQTSPATVSRSSFFYDNMRPL